ncbi:MAG: DUF4131 domain-containing protein [Clostridiales bacterium]|nr:DUF4131 domain-containing protein [Clostridiales bacterium]
MAWFSSGIAFMLLLREYILRDTWLIPCLLILFCGLVLSFVIKKYCKIKDSRMIFAVLGMICAIFVYEGYSRIVYNPAARYSGQTCDISGHAASAPDRAGERVVLRVYEVNGHALRIPFKVQLYNSEALDLRPGDYIEATASLRLPRAYSSFDALHHYKSRGIYLTAVSKEPAYTERLDNPPLWAHPLRFSENLKERLNTMSPDEITSSVLISLIFGDRSTLEDDFYNDITDTGLSHVISVSGMHVSFLVILILKILGMKKGRFAAMPFIVIFTLMTGAPVSAVRALIMQLIYLLSLILGREADSKRSLFLALTIILFFNPYAVCDVSLWLSFSSTLGLILYSMPIAEFFISPFKSVENKLIKRILTVLSYSLGTTLSALLFSTPILIFTFRQVSLIAPISNILLLFLFEICFFGGIISLFLSFIAMPLGTAAAFLLSIICRGIYYTLTLLASIPYASYGTSGVYIVVTAAAVYAIIVFYIFMKKKSPAPRLRYYALACVLCVALGVAADRYEYINSAYLTVIDSGGGQCVILREKDSAVMINCGGYNAAYNASIHLEDMNVDLIDLLVLTDYSSGSISSVSELLERVEVKKIIAPVPDDDTETEAIYVTKSCIESAGDISLYLGVYDSRLMVRAELGDVSLLAPGTLPPEVLGRALYDIGYPETSLVAAGRYYSSHVLPGSVHMLSPRAVVLGAYLPLWEDRIYELTGGIPSYDTTVSGDITFRVSDMWGETRISVE